MKKTGDGYKVTVGDYDYYINVCSKIGGEHCQNPPHDNAAVCQVKHDGTMWVQLFLLFCFAWHRSVEINKQVIDSWGIILQKALKLSMNSWGIIL